MNTIQIFKVIDNQQDPKYNYHGLESFGCNIVMFLDENEAMKYAYKLAVAYSRRTSKLPYTNNKKKLNNVVTDKEDDEDDEDDYDDELPYFIHSSNEDKNIEEMKKYLSVESVYAWHNYLIQVVKDELNLNNTIINKTFI